MTLRLVGMLAAYADLIDGVRSHYARREGDDWVASFSATMLLSALMGINVVSLTAGMDILLHQEFTLRIWSREYRAWTLIVAIGIAVLHVLFARYAGVYDRRGGPRSPSWGKRMRAYIAATIGTFALVIVAIIMSR